MAPLARAIDGERLSSHIGQGLTLIAPDIGNSSPLMQGNFSLTRLRDGMTLHCTDIVHLHDMSTQFVIKEKCVKILLKLEGNADVKIGRQTLPLDAGEGPGAVPQGVVVSLNEPVTFSRNSRAGTHQRMVVLTLTPSWFEAAGIPQNLFRKDLAVFQWEPSLRAIAVAEQLIHPVNNEGPLQMLHQECLALELIVKALSLTLPEEPSQPSTLSAAAYQRVLRLQTLLDSGEADQLDMRGIARAMACNANTLQQQFREVCGQTIFDYLRKGRLQRAAHALQYDGVSVTRAAEIAGYSSQANFSTAFHRHFGSLPKHYRNKS
ncbi:transcriptional regulator, AraC family [Methylobacillus rhizosphaerae]|uniref:Transcriptional regulator, AraC family n=1 Tax=Methylobacillus rhizosphaerae TaxID=551994 RepID=A0A238YXH8_9PROT|nr:AraC family transcriptional regulator [Methylobacillus rhizosphaerae]SNR75807.1 transcriptional regulator, AraC family [Methylobacillus rhizosphaerae]